MTIHDDTNLDARLKTLSPEQRRLLEQRLIERRSESSGQRPIPTRPGTGPCPLAYSQELLWLLDQLAPGSIAYNSPDATRLEGPLDVGALQRAFDALLERNEVLRTTYDLLDGQPMQVVHPHEPFDLHVVDLSGAPEPDEALRRYLKEGAERPFDLREGPVIRADVLHLGPDDHVLLVVVHHIATDGWSKAVLWRELTALYDAFAAGRPSPLAPLPIQYADYAVWHREWLDSGVLSDQLEYWERRLAGVPALLNLPTDRPRPPVQSYVGDHRDLLLDGSILQGLQSLGRSENATLFMTLLAGFSAFLRRYTGQDDVVVGTPTAGRSRVELENMIGYFQNTLALRVDLSGDPTFRELIHRTRETTLGAFAHQEVPYEKVVTAINPERDLSRTPVFQVMMVLQNQRRTIFSPAGIVATPLTYERAWSKFDLTLGAGERGGGLNTNWEFATDLFDLSTVSRMMGHFARIAESAVADPDRSISTLPMLVEGERNTLVRLWNEGPETQQSRCLHELIEAQVDSTPAAVALEQNGKALTYSELERRANQLAHHLRRLGVARNDPVAICTERSFEFVVGLLGILKAGGACLPLDPDYPPDRVAFMLEDTKVPVLLVGGGAGRNLPAGNAHIIRLDDDEETLAAESSARPSPVAAPDDTAYVIYTSGSTGVPRGVLLTHRGLASYTLAAVDLYDLRAADRVLQFSSPSFDISIEEIFPSLTCGATVVLRTPETPIAGSPFVDWLMESRISVLELPTAFWHAWISDSENLGCSIPPSVRLVSFGGEKASVTVYRAWRRIGGDAARLLNTYGPTETSVVASAYEFVPGDEERAEVPIGRPLPNSRLYVLDAHREPVPIGVPGELYIGGEGLARGYHNRPELTREKFLDDPFASSPGARMYATGDIVRWLPDGNVEFIGRTDHQVKIRGFRVEPGEIEVSLERHHLVRAAVVVAREDRPGERRLAAYVVPKNTQRPPAGDDLRAYLGETLPAYMVPPSFTVLDAVPLTPNGKIDRDALPAPPAVAAGADGVAPRDETEARLVQMWNDILGIDEVGVTDDFFAVGGDSLQAVRLFAEIERVFGAKLPLALLFQGATIEHLAGVLRMEEQRSDGWSSVVPLHGEGTKPPLFLFGGIDGETLFYRDLVKNLDPDQPVFGVQPRALGGRETPHTRIEDLAAEYVEELTKFQPFGPYLLGGHCWSGALAYDVAHRLAQQGQRTALVAVIDGTPRLERPTRLELERMKFAEFFQRGLGGKMDWISVRARGLWVKTRKKAKWLAFDAFLAMRKSVPAPLRDVQSATFRALQTYLSPVSPLGVTLFRVDEDPSADPYRPTSWSRVALGGVEIRPIRGDGIRHDNIISEPHVRALAADLTLCIDTALAAVDGDRPDTLAEKALR